MKKIVFAIILSTFCVIGCKKENQNSIIGYWKYVKSISQYDTVEYPIDSCQGIETYNADNNRIRYDYKMNEQDRCKYSLTETTLTLYSEALNGSKWSNETKYWIYSDTLKIESNSGFEPPSYSFFKRLK